jgi:hypothetical protein
MVKQSYLIDVMPSYVRAKNQKSHQGIYYGSRPQPTLDEARAELSEAVSRAATYIFKDKYGPLLGAVSQPAVIEFLKGFELNLSRAKGDLTIVFEELFDRVIEKNPRNKK